MAFIINSSILHLVIWISGNDKAIDMKTNTEINLNSVPQLTKNFRQNSNNSLPIKAEIHGKMIKIYDNVTGNEIQTLTGHEKNIKSIQFSPDGKTLVSEGYDGVVNVWKIV